MTTQAKKIPTDQMVLIAEDSDDDFEITVHALKVSGKFNNPIFRVEDGSDLIDYVFKKGKYKDYPHWKLPGIILLDLNMPGIDGRSALQEIKSNEKLKAIPIVVLTTSDAENDIKDCYKAGANSYIRKPLDLGCFKQVIAEFKKYWFKTSALPKLTS